MQAVVDAVNYKARVFHYVKAMGNDEKLKGLVENSVMSPSFLRKERIPTVL